MPSDAPQAIIVDIDEARIEKLEELFANAGTSCRRYASWDDVCDALETSPPKLVVLGHDAFATTGAFGLIGADRELEAAGVPAVLIYPIEAEHEAVLLLDETDFSAFLRWPSSDEELLHTLDAVVPGLAWLEAPKEPADVLVDWTAGLVTGFHDAPLEQAPEGGLEAATWGDLEELFEDEDERGRRLIVVMPSLSSGSLTSLPLPRLLYFLSVQRRTGQLTVRNERKVVAVDLVEGRLVRRRGAEQAIEQLQAAFAWTSGSYAFEWNEQTDGTTVPLFEFIHDGLRQYVPLNHTLQRFAGLHAGYPAYTTLFLCRLRELSTITRAREAARVCEGEQTLDKLMAARKLVVDDLVSALALGLYTDAVVMLDRPGKCPVGVMYRLHSRLEDVDAEELKNSTPAREDGFSRTMTRALIANLDGSHMRLLAELERAQKEAMEKDPYETFGLFPGCGRQAVRDAFKDLQERYQSKLPTSFPAPIRVTAELLDATHWDAYVILMTQEEAEPSPPPTEAFPDVEPESEMSEVARALYNDLQVQLGELASAEPHEIFGLWPGCGRGEVVRAYARLGKRYDPRRYAAYELPEITLAAQHVNAALNAALDRLLKEEGAVATADAPVDSAPNDHEGASLIDMLDQLMMAHRTAAQGAEEPDEGVLLPPPPNMPVELPPPPNMPAGLQPRPSMRRAPVTPPTYGKIAAPLTDERVAHSDEPGTPAIHQGFAPTPAPSAEDLAAPLAPQGRPAAPTERPSASIGQPSLRPPQEPARPPVAIQSTSDPSRRRPAPTLPPKSAQPAPSSDDLPMLEVEALELTPGEHFRQGERLLRRKDFEAARGAFRRAAKGEPENGLYVAYQGWAEYLADPKSKVAQNTLKKAQKFDDGRAMASFFLGSIALNAGELAEAQKYLKLANREAPKNQDIVRAQRLVKMRLDQAKAKSSGLLGRLLGRE